LKKSYSSGLKALFIALPNGHLFFFSGSSFERIDSYSFVSVDETTYLDAIDGDCSLNRKWRSWSVLFSVIGCNNGFNG
jgi:hypothetical protein